MQPFSDIEVCYLVTLWFSSSVYFSLEPDSYELFTLLQQVFDELSFQPMTCILSLCLFSYVYVKNSLNMQSRNDLAVTPRLQYSPLPTQTHSHQPTHIFRDKYFITMKLVKTKKEEKSLLQTLPLHDFEQQ